jgi:hypothetical protein
MEPYGPLQLEPSAQVLTLTNPQLMLAFIGPEMEVLRCSLKKGCAGCLRRC